MDFSGGTMRIKGMLFLAELFLIGQCMAEINPNPPARTHARLIGNKYYKFTSKLKTVIELNFTLNFNHTSSKATLDATLDKIATDYGLAGAKAFTIKRFVGPGNGASVGLPTTVPILADFLSGEVIVDNNISNMNQIPVKSATLATAFETAVKTNGRGVLGVHASGDGGVGWGFYTNDLHPTPYHEIGNPSHQPIYKYELEAKHIITDSVLSTGTQVMEVPIGVDANKKEIKANVPVRMMKNEWYRFGRNLGADTTYAPLTTCLMKFDPTAIPSSDFGSQYSYPGGNPFAWVIKVGAGKALYLLSGHDNSELTDSTYSFDGGTGDYERFVAQSLFYLAGYDSTACGTTDCTGLPIVDDKDHLTGKNCGATCGEPVSFIFNDNFSVTSTSGKTFVAQLTDVRGRLVATKIGRGVETIHFNPSNLNPGVYIMSVKVGKETPFGSYKYYSILK
jgi:hypothetical protein